MTDTPGRQAVYNFNRILEQIAGLYRALHGMAVLHAEYKLLFLRAGKLLHMVQPQHRLDGL